jgi:glyoxylase-like metal-dependent hydrolase (beta-lactamase superfamily II)
MAGQIICIPMEHEIPAGAMGPAPMRLDVRAYLVPHATGLVLVDTGMDPAGDAIQTALAGAGASWSDVSDVVLTHAHPDHVGALDQVKASAPNVTVHAHPSERLPGASAVDDGSRVGTLRVFATPGHTAGHISLIDNDRGALLIGDCLGVVDGQLVRAPDPFTADRETAERSLERLRDLRDLRDGRMLFAHGPEIASPWTALDLLLVR